MLQVVSKAFHETLEGLKDFEKYFNQRCKELEDEGVDVSDLLIKNLDH